MMPTTPAITPTVAPQGSGHSGVGAEAAPTPPAAPSAAAGAASAQPTSGRRLDDALPWLRKAAAESGVDLIFRVDRESDRIVVLVTDRRDGSILRQIPSEEALRIADHLKRSGGTSGGLIAAIV